MWGGIHFDTNMTYMKTEARVNTNDLRGGSGAELALNGFGSRLGAADQCTIAEAAAAANAGNAAVGCYFFNPFTNSRGGQRHQRLEPTPITGARPTRRC